MRTDASRRTFPYQRHEVRPPEKMLVPIIGGVTFSIVLLLLAPSMPREPIEARVLGYSALAWLLFALATLPFRAGFGGLLPGRVAVFRGATWITAKVFPVEQAAFLGGSVALGVIGATNIAYFGLNNLIAAGPRGIVLGPIFAVLGMCGIAVFVGLQLRGIKMTPDSFTYWRGFGRITLGWDELGDALSTDDVRDHEGNRIERDKYLPGAKIVVPAYLAEHVKLPVLWEDGETPRLLLETDHFSVEPSALLTAVLALRDNPGLRPLLGTRESKVLFKGPPWRVRRRMYRPQQWWPDGAVPDGITVDSDGVVRAHL